MDSLAIPHSAQTISQNPTRADLLRQLTWFFALTYAIAWLSFVPLSLSREGLGWLPVSLPLPLMTVLGTIGLSGASVLTAIAAHALFNTRSRWLGGLLCEAPLRDTLPPFG